MLPIGRRLIFGLCIGVFFSLLFICVFYKIDQFNGLLDLYKISPIVFIVPYGKGIILFDVLFGLTTTIFAIALLLKQQLTPIRIILIIFAFWLGTSVTGQALYRYYYKANYYLIIGKKGIKTAKNDYESMLWSSIRDITLKSNTVIIELMDGTLLEIYDFKLTLPASEIYKNLKKIQLSAS